MTLILIILVLLVGVALPAWLLARLQERYVQRKKKNGSQP